MSDAGAGAFLKNFWRVSSFQLLNSACAFLVNLYVARRIGPQLFGDFYFFVSTAIIGTILFDFGLTRTLLRYSSFHQARGEVQEKLQYYRSVFLLKSWLGLAVLGAGLLAGLLWGEHLRWPLALGLLTGFIVSYCQFFAGVAQTEGNYLAYNLVLSFNTLRLALVVALAVAGWMNAPNLYGVFLAAPLLLAAVPAWRLTRDMVRAGGAPEPHFLRNILRFGKWLILLSVLETLSQRLDMLMVRTLTSAEQAGYYAGALAFFGVVYMLPTYSAVLMYPHFVEAVSRGDQSELSRRYRFSTDLMAILAIPMALGMWAISPDLVGGFLGHKFADSAPLFKYMAVYSLLLGVHLNSGAVFFAKDRPELVVVIVASTLATALAGNLVLIPRLGIAGAGLALCASMVVSLSLSWGLIRRRFRLWPDWGHLAAYLSAGAVMVLAVRAVPAGGWTALAGKVLLGAAAYGAGVWAVDRWRGGGFIPRGLAGAGW